MLERVGARALDADEREGRRSDRLVALAFAA
jgi:hypothetical protein